MVRYRLAATHKKTGERRVSPRSWLTKAAAEQALKKVFELRKKGAKFDKSPFSYPRIRKYK